MRLVGGDGARRMRSPPAQDGRKTIPRCSIVFQRNGVGSVLSKVAQQDNRASPEKRAVSASALAGPLNVTGLCNGRAAVIALFSMMAHEGLYTTGSHGILDPRRLALNLLRALGDCVYANQTLVGGLQGYYVGLGFGTISLSSPPQR